MVHEMNLRDLETSWDLPRRSDSCDTASDSFNSRPLLLLLWFAFAHCSDLQAIFEHILQAIRCA